MVELHLFLHQFVLLRQSANIQVVPQHMVAFQRYRFEKLDYRGEIFVNGYYALVEISELLAG